MRLLTNDELAHVAGANDFEDYIVGQLGSQLNALWSGVQASGYTGNLGSYIYAGTVPAGANQTLTDTLHTFYGTYAYTWLCSEESYFTSGIDAWTYMSTLTADMASRSVNVTYDIYVVETALTSEFYNMSTYSPGYNPPSYNPTNTFNQNQINHAISQGYYPNGQGMTGAAWQAMYGYDPW
jgi:hypothetical protein